MLPLLGMAARYEGAREKSEYRKPEYRLPGKNDRNIDQRE